MNEEPGNFVPPKDSLPVFSLPTHSRLARISFRLACMGPVALLLTAMLDPWHDNFTLPAFPWQAFWWLLWFLPSLGVLVGFIALGQIRRSAWPAAGMNYALAGIVVGLPASIVLAFGIPNLKEISKQIQEEYAPEICEARVGWLIGGMQMYAQDYDDHLPGTGSWNEAIMPYVKDESFFHCPAEHQSKDPSYAMNRRLGSLKVSEINSPKNVVVLFESIPGKNKSGGKGMLLTPPRHDGVTTIGFVDGHAEFIGNISPPPDPARLVWKPKKKPKHKKPARQKYHSSSRRNQ